MALEVPRYDERLVRPAPLPGPPRRSGQPLDAFGGGGAAEGAFRAAGDLAGTGGQIGQAGFNHEAEAAVRDYMGQLSAEEARISLKVKRAKGSDAFGATDQAMKEYDQSRDKILGGIGNVVVRDKVSAHAQSFRDSLFRASELHVAGERDNYDLQRTQALVKNERDNASSDYVDPDSPSKPKRVMESIARQRAAVADRMRGQAPETIAAAQAVEESKTHMAVLDRMLAGGNDALADEYYKANQAGFFGDDKAQAERALEHGSYLGKATRAVDFIFAPSWIGKTPSPGARTWSDVQKETSKIEDPKLRHLTEQLARQRLDDMKRDEHQTAVENYEAAARIIDANPNKKPETLIPPAQWVALPAEYRDALSRRAVKEMDDSKAWLAWMDFARDHRAAAALDKTDFEVMYWSHLNPTHREQAIKEWQTAGEAASKAGAKLTEYNSLYTAREMILNSLRRAQIAGIDDEDTLATIQGDKDKRKALVDYTDRIEQAFRQHFADHSKMPDDTQKQSIIDRLIWRDKEVKVERPTMKWLPDVTRKLKDLSDDEIRRIDSGFDEIPVHSVDTIRRIASARFGLKLDPDTSSADKLRIARAYMASILGKDDLVESILRGK